MYTLRVTLVLLLLTLLSACGSLSSNSTATPGKPTLNVDISKIVQATFQAMTAEASSQPTLTAIPATSTSTAAKGTITGTLNYPADSLPSMYVTAYQVGTQTYKYVLTNAGQGTFKIEDLPPGTYHVVAYTVGGAGFPAGLAGGYTKAVPCGLATECSDHSLIDVSVGAGQVAKDVKVYDWNAPDGTFPPFPQASATSAVGGTGTPAAEAGGIAGDLRYPASALPALRIVAMRVGSSDYYYIDTALGESSYQINNIPAGTYHVVAYVLPGGGFTGGLAGGYSQMVPCGLQATCTDHTLIDVVVTAGHVTTGADPNDYYADVGTFPPNPVP